MKNLSRIDEPKDLLTKEYLDENLPKIFGGGRNFWIESRMTGDINKELLPENHITKQRYCYRLNNAQSIVFDILPEYSDELYRNVTFSAWLKYENVVVGANPWNLANVFKHRLYLKNSKTNVESSISYDSLGVFSGTKDWHKVTFNMDYRKSGYDLMKTDLRFYLEHATSGTMWVAGIKVELGDVATPWTPAPEDILDRLAKIEQKIGM